VNTDLANLNSWKSHWQGQIQEVKKIGGCDCHVTEYRICATQAAIEDFPKYDYDPGD